MGREADGVLHRGRSKAEGRAYLSGTEVQFKPAKGERLTVPIAAIKEVEARGASLHFKAGRGRYRLELGSKEAEHWFRKIRYPKSRIDKLGVKPGQRVSVLYVDDPDLMPELEERTDDIGRGRTRKNSDWILVGVKAEKELKRLDKLEAAIKRDGSIWVIWPKGRKEFGDRHVRAHVKSLDLVDVKNIAFNDELTALKLMIPKARR